MPKQSSYHPDDGGRDKPYYSGDVRMGRNAEISDEFTLKRQAAEAIDKARKSTKDGDLNPGDYGIEKKITDPPLSV